MDWIGKARKGRGVGFGFGFIVVAERGGFICSVCPFLVFESESYCIVRMYVGR